MARFDRFLGGKPLIDKPKKGRPRSKNPMVHTAVVLPRALIEDLRKDAAASGQGLSAEIRKRLEMYDLPIGGLPFDSETNRLLNAIKALSEVLARDMSGTRWHQHPYALRAFKAGIETLLARYHPEGRQDIRPATPSGGEPDDAPEFVGRTHARPIGIANHEDEGE